MVRTKTPARANAWETVFVIAASVRNIADMVNLTRTVNIKKMKNCEAVGSSPARK